MVGEAGFEPTTSASRTQRAAKLRHSPKNGRLYLTGSRSLHRACANRLTGRFTRTRCEDTSVRGGAARRRLRGRPRCTGRRRAARSAALRNRNASIGLISQPSASRAAGEEDVGLTVEQHQHRHPRSRPAPDSSRSAMHVAMPPMLPIWRSSTTSVGCQLGHCGWYVHPSTHPSHGTLGRGQGGLDLVVDPVRIGGYQHIGHGGRLVGGCRGGSIFAAAGYDRSRIRTPSGERVLEIQVESSTDYIVCRPVGELDAYTVGQFRERLGRAGRVAPAAHRSLVGSVHGLGRSRRARSAASAGPARRGATSPSPAAGRRSTRLLHTTGFDRIVPGDRHRRGRRHRARHRRRRRRRTAATVNVRQARRGVRRPRRGRRGRGRPSAGTAPARPARARPVRRGR